jgi:hypothetical protein
MPKELAHSDCARMPTEVASDANYDGVSDVEDGERVDCSKRIPLPDS